jgi:hypothetical protein
MPEVLLQQVEAVEHMGESAAGGGEYVGYGAEPCSLALLRWRRGLGRRGR